MIPSHQERSARADEAVSLLLVAGTTPHSGWQRLLPLFERAGCTLPVSALLEEWQASAHGSAALGQSGVAMLHPGSHHQSLRSATATLLGACLSPVLLSVEDMEARPEFWLEELPESRLLMLHSRPEAALVTAMSEDGSLENALAGWTSAAEAMVRIFRRHRRRVTVIDVECALAAPIDFLRSCKTSFGLNPLPYSATTRASDRMGSDMQYLIAAQMVAQSPKALDLIAELEACSLPIGAPSMSPAVDCAALYARQREEQEQRKLAEEDRARYRLLADEYAGRLAVTERARDEAMAQFREAENRLLEAKDQRELIVQQLQNTREALEIAAREQQRQSSDNEELLQIQKKLQSDLQTMMAEKEALEHRFSVLSCTLSEQSAQLVEAQRKFESQEQASGGLKQENELLTLQLHRAQEAIDAAILERQRQSSSTEELLLTQERLQSEIQGITSEKKELERRISDLACSLGEQSAVIAECDAKVEAAERVVCELKNENELLFLQLHQAQEELETCHGGLGIVNGKLEAAERKLGLRARKLNSLQTKLNGLERKLRFRERRIRYLEESRSWRMTAPFRQAMGLLYRRKKDVDD